jgi:Uma2 family endonuclease
MATLQQIMTAKEVLNTPGLGRCELICGELIMMSPAGFEHGRIVINISIPLGNYVKHQELGVLTGAETGFQISSDPDTVRAPDIGFIRADRVPAAPIQGFFPGAPDLAVEVLSPNDRASEVLSKVKDWLAAGCRAVWVADPDAHTVSVYRTRDDKVFWQVADELSGEDVLPGFKLPVAEIFAR